MRTMVGWLHQYLRANITNSDGSAVVMMVRLAVLQFYFLLIFVSLSHAARLDIKSQKKIRGGVTIGNHSMKRQYPCMARLVSDGACRCGGTVISEK